MAVPLFFSQLVPKEYRPLLAAISPAAFNVVEWKELLKEIPILVGRIGNREQTDKLAKALNTIWTSSEQSTSVDFGQFVLELYFAQLFNPQGLFLDLRQKNFIVSENDQVTFVPNGFWIQWKDSFRLGLVNIYTGYYKNQTEKLDLGLRQVGLVEQGMSEEKIAEIKAMLLSHLGGNYKNQEFFVSDFTLSFERFFNFLQRNKIRLSADFLYLGIYLASLYHCLEKISGSYDVQKCFLKVEEHVKT